MAFAWDCASRRSRFVSSLLELGLEATASATSPTSRRSRRPAAREDNDC
jgi:hypothetical protein